MAFQPLIPVQLLLFSLLPTISSSPSSSSPVSSPVIGVNYGQVANNLPSPDEVLPLIRSVGAGRLKLYDTDPTVLRAFAGTDIEFIVGLPDQLVPKLRDPAAALSWVKSNLQTHIPRTKITAVTIGNEILSSNNTLLIQSLIPAIQSVHSALVTLNLDRQVAVTTAHSLTILSTSYPPSAGRFRRDLLPYISPLINFLNKTGSPFLINAYPFFAYKADPKRVSLDYVLFQPSAGVVDSGTGLRYRNMLHAQVDAVVTAIAAAGGEKTVEVRVSETGWPSAGDEDEVGATLENARRYNGNLMKMVAEGKGTPMQPRSPLQVYVFALFNENMKPGPSSERHYGLFKPDGTLAYNIGVTVPGLNSTTSGDGGDGGNGGGDESSPLVDSASPGIYYTVYSAVEEGRRAWLSGAMAVVGLILQLVLV
ncbi:glucan endo-1,3-beta-glucosidase 11-like [Phalaenopsis equestris]|uniref:glucan endo-1,3-beta-glucosidase 11-like n=1 Tax=Phalaenopsis equestris TaxID=78828 RepID=UPI0009E2E34B|nr:glucan endo-1,3-beta-glucosidase 11-like [Phalaenopsis equestris]